MAKFFVLFFLRLLFASSFALKQSYVVYMGGHEHGPHATTEDFERATNSHVQFLSNFFPSEGEAKEAMFYSYTKHINGFAATLDEEQAAQIAKDRGVVSVFLNKERQLHTTHSWDFMMLEKNGVVHPSSLWKKARFGEDVIIGNLDTGVWPESKSFADDDYGPVPDRWKGGCQNDTRPHGVPCNRKLIGARYFNHGYKSNGGVVHPSHNSPRDYEGHGSHTLSTAAGNFVPGASVFGVGNGTAKGGSPRARVAAYKVCWPTVNGTGGCYDSDIIQGFDMAIHDGVDVVSVSLGGGPEEYFYDPVAIGAFHAAQKGVAVVCSGGNSGPTSGTVSNTAPWMITVAASTLDRDFRAYAELGNGKRFQGEGLSMQVSDAKLHPLITGAQAKSTNATTKEATLCMEGSLDPKKVKGKIVACLRGINARAAKGLAAANAGAVGMILCNDKSDGNDVVADAHLLPAIHINYKDGVAVFSYINSTDNPMGSITNPKTVMGATPAPAMAAFSSQGPNTVTPQILKPDITAPGVNIIAAYSGAVSPTELPSDKRRVAYATESGTSMSCPHISGVVGLLKSFHPNWSAAAIRSAIMTTARSRDNTVHPVRDASDLKATPFNYGAGHVRPNQAMDPGLVYDLTINDYFHFLCAIGYNQTMIERISRVKGYACPSSANLQDFNYPSFSVPKLGGTVTLTRTVKNVGMPGAYTVAVREPVGVSISVEPKTLKFEKVGEEKSYKVTFKAKDRKPRDYNFGHLVWSDGKHYVRSPIAVSRS